jgi:hypothetical protein
LTVFPSIFNGLSLNFQSTIFSLDFQLEILLSIIERVSVFIEGEPTVGLYRQALASIPFKIAFFSAGR